MIRFEELPDNTLDRIDDPVWERFMDKLLDEYDDEDAVFEDNDIPRLRNLVRRREILRQTYI